ncbi:cytochrome c1 [Sphingomonas nostoxanthinifaciens]|uniref:cytochrome c1 n=1 Tax=Sphingomonas nostoxanthinifaciens TaxID=2872652 RepID=UPI001CC1F200|nr:cytochrome c1 [Sphingomonas nostoxanthinifaciens]UAK25145.1 cytochrome c1 [Sphingomonas nostoxanthinifaciens]
MLVKPIAGLVGLGFVSALAVAFVIPREKTEPTAASVYHKGEKEVSFSFDGPLGRYDRRQLQRGFQVYKEVCSACHSMKLVAFRDLEEIGFTKPEVKAIAKQWSVEVPTINPDTGEATTRKAIPSDYFPSPFANEVAARAANNNALPPDMSLLAKAREGGPHYIYSLVTGYQPQPADLLKAFPDAKTPPSLYYNPYFANLNIAMPPPLVADGQVSYSDGTKANVDQMAQDVSAFLMWAAEPKLENRHRVGTAVLIYLLIATGLAYGAYRNIWRGKKH